MLKLKDIELSYGKTMVLKKLNMEVIGHEIFGLVGPENAGKSSVCKIIAGVLSPDSGTVTMFDQNISIDDAKRGCIGYLPQQVRIYDYQFVLEYFIFFGKLYGMSEEEAKKRGKDIIKFVGLEGKEMIYASQLSRGEQLKLGIGRALLSHPKLVILDEVFSGLDPVSCREIQTLIHRMKQMGVSVFITSNYMENVSKLCDRMAIIDEGVIITSGTAEDIQYLKLSANPIMIRVEKSMEEAEDLLRANPDVISLSRKDNLLSVRFKGTVGTEADLLTELIQNNVRVSAFYREESDFDSLYLKIKSK